MEPIKEKSTLSIKEVLLNMVELYNKKRGKRVKATPKMYITFEGEPIAITTISYRIEIDTQSKNRQFDIPVLIFQIYNYMNSREPVFTMSIEHKMRRGMKLGKGVKYGEFKISFLTFLEL